MDPLCGSRYWPNLWDFATSHYHTNTEAICHMFCYSKHCNKFSFMQSYYPRYTVEICHIIRKTLSMSVVAAVASWVIKHNSKSITPTHGGGGGLAQCFCYYVCLHSSAITLVERMLYSGNNFAWVINSGFTDMSYNNKSLFTYKSQYRFCVSISSLTPCVTDSQGSFYDVHAAWLSCCSSSRL